MIRDEKWLLDEKYDGKKTPEFFSDCARLDAGEPLAFVIGSVPFLNTTIHLDSRPLIPRVETEYWTEKAVSAIGNRNAPRVLDLCAGSGCIGVAVLKGVPAAHVDFAEIVERHHPTILKNVHENGIDTSRTNIFGGDLFEHVVNTYDVILANPPYIPEDSTRVEKSVIEYEPYSALYGGNAGTDVIARILRESPRYLKENGTLYIEHEPEQADFIREEGGSHGFAATTFPDQYGVSRYTVLVRKT